MREGDGIVKRITVIETRNGFLVVDGLDCDGLRRPHDLAAHSWSFNSLDAAIAQIRRVLKSWREAKGEEAGDGNAT